MSDKKKVIVVGNAHKGIDAARKLGVRAYYLHLYQSSNSRRAKLHLMKVAKDQGQGKLLCGSSIVGSLINDEVGKNWVQSANLAPMGMCARCLKAANNMIDGLA